LQWQGYLIGVAAVLGATLLIKACCLLGSPRTVEALYIPVVAGVAMLIGRWPALLACALAFVLNDVLFVTPGRFAPGPEQIAVALVVAVSCLVLSWLVRAQRPMRLLGSLIGLLPG
jgi:K+-sensing histidine kinase KdpD